MLDAIAHRGPDTNGVWNQDSVGLILGHTRLAVIDVSATGAQPMVSTSGRYVLSYNGEIYNHLKLRASMLRDYRINEWRGESDLSLIHI